MDLGLKATWQEVIGEFFVECPPTNFTLKVGAIIRYGVHPKWIRIESHEMRTLIP